MAFESGKVSLSESGPFILVPNGLLRVRARSAGKLLACLSIRKTYNWRPGSGLGSIPQSHDRALKALKNRLANTVLYRSPKDPVAMTVIFGVSMAA